jgi:hypothetical protein
VRHPSLDLETELERRALFDRAGSAAEVARLQAAWNAEDERTIAAGDARARELKALQARVAVLENVLGDGGRSLARLIIDATAEALGNVLVQTKGEIMAQVERQGFLVYRNIWSPEAEYPHGSLVTCKGAGWVALGAVPKGIRPGSDPVWQLAVKGETGKGPAVA